MIDLLCLPLAFAVLYAFAATPLMRAADKPATLELVRSSPIDGLRGVLALAVVFYHGYLTEHLLRDGSWQVPTSRSFAHLGPSAVEVFFMITGYLFWRKILRDRGRPEWMSLYVGRLFRIGPVYLLAIALMLVSVGIRTRWELHGTVRHLVHEIIVWLPLGAQAGAPDINGLPRTFLLTAGVIWSLRYEWGFYAALVVIALIARLEVMQARLVVGLALALSLAWAVLSPGPASSFPSWPITFALFLSGMFAAELPPLSLTRQWRLPLSVGVVAMCAASLLAQSSFSAWSVGCLAIAFYVIASGGCSVFGLLTTRAARRMGDVSYPLYMLHGLVLSTLAVIVPPLPAPVFWLVLALAAIVAVALATAAHTLVERPGVECGQRIIKALNRIMPGGRVVTGQSR